MSTCYTPTIQPAQFASQLDDTMCKLVSRYLNESRNIELRQQDTIDLLVVDDLRVSLLQQYSDSQETGHAAPSVYREGYDILVSSPNADYLLRDSDQTYLSDAQYRAIIDALFFMLTPWSQECAMGQHGYEAIDNLHHVASEDAPPPKAVTARLPHITIGQLAAIQRATGMTQTQVLIQAIDRMAREGCNDRK